MKHQHTQLLNRIKDLENIGGRGRSQSPGGRNRSQSPGRNEPYSKSGGKGLAARSRTPSPGRDGNDRSRSRYDNYGQRPSTPGPN